MTLLRRLIRSTVLPPWCHDDKILSEIRQIALQTAQGAISFAKNLRPDQLEAFWYFSKSSTTPTNPNPILPPPNLRHQLNSLTVPLLPPRLLHNPPPRNLPLLPRALLLAGDPQLLPLAPAHHEQRQHAHAVRRHPP